MQKVTREIYTYTDLQNRAFEYVDESIEYARINDIFLCPSHLLAETLSVCEYDIDVNNLDIIFTDQDFVYMDFEEGAFIYDGLTLDKMLSQLITHRLYTDLNEYIEQLTNE